MLGQNVFYRVARRLQKSAHFLRNSSRVRNHGQVSRTLDSHWPGVPDATCQVAQAALRNEKIAITGNRKGWDMNAREP
jgi:hypothetical protein